MVDRTDQAGDSDQALRPDTTLRTQPPSPAAQASYAARAYVPRVNNGGNFCDHSPLYPALEIPILLHDKFPPLLKTLCERISRYYYDPDEWLPSVNGANGSPRQQRSERREAIVLLLTAIVRRTELTSLRCGTPTKDGFRPCSLADLAELAGINLQRASRALRDLRLGGLITCYQKRYLNDEGHYRAYYAVRKLNRAIFGLFGIAERQVKAAMKFATKQLKAKAERWDEQSQHRVNVRDILKIKIMVKGAFGEGPAPQSRRSHPRGGDPPDTA